jgi:hypothetical protein
MGLATERGQGAPHPRGPVLDDEDGQDAGDLFGHDGCLAFHAGDLGLNGPTPDVQKGGSWPPFYAWIARPICASWSA